MLEETGAVVEVEDDTLWVETRSRSSCGRCTSDGCTTSVVAKLFGVKRNRLQLKNSLGAKVGDQVVIGIPDDVLVRASLWAYFQPLVFALVGAFWGHAMGFGEGTQGLLAMGGVALGFFIGHRATRDAASRARFRPRLLRIANHAEVAVEVPFPSPKKRD